MLVRKDRSRCQPGGMYGSVGNPARWNGYGSCPHVVSSRVLYGNPFLVRGGYQLGVEILCGLPEWLKGACVGGSGGKAIDSSVVEMYRRSLRINDRSVTRTG